MGMEVILPKLEFSMSEGTLTEWLVADGCHVKTGTPLYTLESGKAVQEMESPAEGTLRILVEPGGPYAVGTVLGSID